jgi:predicted enzyme related to lactoylglutathione lyase
MKNAVNWFEIPVKNLSRAQAFYETILSAKMHPMEAMGMKSAFFPADMENGVGGSLVENAAYQPADKGTLVYLNGGDDLSIPLAKVEVAGGKVVMPKTSIGPNGFIAHFTDTEGNKVAFHSMQ